MALTKVFMVQNKIMSQNIITCWACKKIKSKALSTVFMAQNTCGASKPLKSGALSKSQYSHKH